MNIKAMNITKLYGKKKALDEFSMELDSGIYAFLGPNGAGKTTLINIITQLIKPTGGNILYDGEKINKNRKALYSRLGFLPQNAVLYKSFTAEENIKYFARLKDVKLADNEIDELLEKVNLSDCKRKKAGGFSGGMLQRLCIAVALIGEPDLLIFDEPTAGLDPQERIRFRSIVSKLADKRTVIISTHIVSDIESIAKQVLLIKSGHLIAQKSVSDLCASIDGSVWSAKLPYGEADSICERYKISNIFNDGQCVSLRIISEEKPCESAETCSPTLEDVYLYCFDERDEVQ